MAFKHNEKTREFLNQLANLMEKFDVEFDVLDDANGWYATKSGIEVSGKSTYVEFGENLNHADVRKEANTSDKDKD